MVLLTVSEVLNAVIMSFIVGFIFSDTLAQHLRGVSYHMHHLPGLQKQGFLTTLFSKQELLNIFYATLIVAPAIVFHELGHKFVAMAFGLYATFNAAYPWLALGVLLKLLNFGFIFFVPAYVSISGNAPPLANALIAFAGPCVNALLYWISSYLHEKVSKSIESSHGFGIHNGFETRFGKAVVIKFTARGFKKQSLKKLHDKVLIANALFLSKEINKFLCLFNLLPIPGFDGWHVITNLILAVSKPL